ncbi:MAG: glycosyltransferase family 39 protein [Planctomycetes bacterium]|nr:glycosyltransferase family 39 protein [Planctomycetota bacterium]
MISRSRAAFYILAALLVVVAFVVRYPAVWYSYPFSGHPDEHHMVNAAFGIARTGDLNPHIYKYPSLNFYLIAGVYRIRHAVSAIFGGPGFLGEQASPDHYVVARIVILTLACLTILALAELGRRMAHPVAGLLAAALLAANPIQTSLSFTATVDTTVGLWATCAVLAAVWIYEEPTRLRNYIAAGIFVGFAGASKYPGCLVALPVILASLLSRPRSRRAQIRNLCIFLLLCPAVFLATTPFAALDFHNFWTQMSAEGRAYATGQDPTTESPTGISYVQYADEMWKKCLGVWPTVFGGIGIAWFAWRKWRLGIVLLSFPLALYLFIGSFKVFFVRNLIGGVPCLLLFSAAGVHGCWSLVRGETASFAFRSVRWWAAALLLAAGATVSLYWPVTVSRDHIRRASLPDTRNSTLEWIRANIPANSRIAREMETPPIELYYNDYQVAPIGTLVRPDQRSLMNQYDYLIVGSSLYERVRRRARGLEREIRSYDEFLSKQTILAKFLGDGVNNTGPANLVVQLRH